jgi:hypothetical protein
LGSRLAEERSLRGKPADNAEFVPKVSSAGFGGTDSGGREAENAPLLRPFDAQIREFGEFRSCRLTGCLPSMIASTIGSQPVSGQPKSTHLESKIETELEFRAGAAQIVVNAGYAIAAPTVTGPDLRILYHPQIRR